MQCHCGLVQIYPCACVPEVSLDLADPHVHPAVVLADVEIEVLVLDPAVSPLGQLALEAAVVGAELLGEVGQRVPELDHALGRDGNLRSGAAAGNCLGHSQEPSARVLFEIQIIPPEKCMMKLTFSHNILTTKNNQ